MVANTPRDLKELPTDDLETGDRKVSTETYSHNNEPETDSRRPVKKTNRAKLIEIFQRKSKESATKNVELQNLASNSEVDDKDQEELHPGNTTMQLQHKLTDGGVYLPRPQYAEQKSKPISSHGKEESDMNNVEFMDCKQDTTV